MNKEQKANDAILMAILEMIRGGSSGNAAATAAIAQANIKRDGADKHDIDEIVANQMLPLQEKIAYNISEHPEIMDEIEDFAIKNNIPEPRDMNEFGNIIEMYLKTVRGYGKGGQFEENVPLIDVQINGKTYSLLHLTTDAQKEQGLMDIEYLNDNEGALFDYSDEPQPEISFWMQNTHIGLDICFINEQGKVISVKKGVPESEDLITEDSEFVAYVIEVSKNSGIKAGDQTSLGETIEETDPDEDDSPELPENHLVIYGSDGQPQGWLRGGERIFSRANSKTLINMAKRAYKTKADSDYKRLGKKIFEYIKQQDERPPEYVNN